MLCTKWFLPLFFLPLPTAPPLFLLLFIISLVAHARPCFYCIILISTIFVSSCYWQPLPIDSPLTVPWADNVTTFADALRATIAADHRRLRRPFPAYIRPLDRCWCDLSGGLLEPFNVSRWERNSVLALRDAVAPAPPPRPKRPVAPPPPVDTDPPGEMTQTPPAPPRTEPGLRYATRTPEPEPEPEPTLDAKRAEAMEKWLRWLGLPRRAATSLKMPADTDMSSSTAASATAASTPPSTAPPSASPTSDAPPPEPIDDLPSEPEPSPDLSPPLTFEKDRVVDLRPYGITLVLDFRWAYMPYS
ncbi:hypothetical protein HDZ31DRAFT_59724 [Schizophyllum fasciatum]